MASNSLEKPLRPHYQQRAFELFLEELATELKSAEMLVQDDSQLNGSPSSHFSSTFHRLKGGAGFLGLTEVERIAGELEKIGAELAIHTRVHEAKDLLTELGGKLQELVENKNEESGK